MTLRSSKESSLKCSIGQLFAETPNLCLWFSGGNDSRLLLEIMLEEQKPFGILRFDTGWSRQQRRQVDAIIIKHNLQVFSYPKSLHMLISEGEQISFVAGYAIDQTGEKALLVSDLIEGDTCAFELITEQALRPQAPIEFDLHIWGSRFEDDHYSISQVLPSAEWTLGAKRFVAPLADWTREEVMSALAARGITREEAITGDIECCHRCLVSDEKVFCPKAQKEIDSVKWDKAANLKMFRQLLGHN